MNKPTIRRGPYPIAWPDRVGVANGTKAVATGEFRIPRRGEWYLSGAIVEAYQAVNELSAPFHIARLEGVR